MQGFKNWMTGSGTSNQTVVKPNILPFMEWALNENTVSQILKQKKSPKIQKALREAKGFVQRNLEEANERSVATIAKWYVWVYLKEIGSDFGDFTPWLQTTFVAHRDFIASGLDESGNLILNNLKSSFNDPKYTLGNLGSDIDLWHERLEASAGSMPAEGDVYLDLAHLGSGWEGWKWIDLGAGSCSQEGKAMGHCGNVGAKEGDTILSLRDPKGKAHLSFILNDGKLGEMKGRANTKPKPAFHPAIVELLKQDEVQYVIGGGYLPENNFSLDDLDDDVKAELLEEKPDLESGIDAQIEEIEERLTEIGEEYNSKWEFCHADATADENDGKIYINIRGGWYLDIGDWDVAGLPKWNDREKKNELDVAIKAALKGLDIGDATIDGDSIRCDIENEWSSNVSYDDPDEFDSYCSYLDSDIEPKKQQCEQAIMSALMELGYMDPSFSSQVLGYADDQESEAQWRDNEFRHFSWGEAEADDETAPHTIQVWLENPDKFILGNLEGMSDNAFRRGNKWEQEGFKTFQQTMNKYLYELAQRQAKMATQQQVLPGFQNPQQNPPFSDDLKVKPVINLTKEYGGQVIYMGLEFFFTMMDSKEDIMEAKAFISFLDNNLDAFMKIAQQTFNNHVLPAYRQSQEPQQQQVVPQQQQAVQPQVPVAQPQPPQPNEGFRSFYNVLSAVDNQILDRSVVHLS